jgi:MFS family permease
VIRPFRGWLVVAAAFAATFLGFGSAYSFSAFLESLQREFGASRGEVSLVFSLAGFLSYALGIVSGPLADRWSSRGFAVAGMLLTGGGLVLASFAASLLQVYLAYGIGGGVGLGCVYVPIIGAVQRWFVRRRGFASGLAVSGIGVGTLTMPPLASFLITRIGWREAYLVVGRVAEAREQLTHRLDRSPTAEEIARHLELARQHRVGLQEPAPRAELFVREPPQSGHGQIVGPVRTIQPFLGNT